MTALPKPRGACPSLPKPMATGDGLLARVALAAPLTPSQLGWIAVLAASCGNGTIGVTARGNLQVRGLSSASAATLAEGIGALAIPVREGLAVETGPLAGVDPTERLDARSIVAEIARGALAFADRLAPKVAVIIDGGGVLHLDSLPADIRLRAHAAERLSVEAGGAVLGDVAASRAGTVVLALLAGLAAEGPAARMRDVVARDGVDGLRAQLRIAGLAVRHPPRAPVDPIGLHRIAGGEAALGIGLAFGLARAADVSRLAELAQLAGIGSIVPSFMSSLLLIGPTLHLTGLTTQASAMGFITDPGDPKRSVFACPGRPSCASAHIETLELAAFLAPVAKGRRLHVSGCAKGCAQPAAAALTIVGLDGGAGLVFKGGPRDSPSVQIPEAELAVRARSLLETNGG